MGLDISSTMNPYYCESPCAQVSIHIRLRCQPQSWRKVNLASRHRHPLVIPTKMLAPFLMQMKCAWQKWVRCIPMTRKPSLRVVLSRPQARASAPFHQAESCWFGEYDDHIVDWPWSRIDNRNRCWRPGRSHIRIHSGVHSTMLPRCLASGVCLLISY